MMEGGGGWMLLNVAVVCASPTAARVHGSLLRSTFPAPCSCLHVQLPAMVGFGGRSHEEDVVDVLGGTPRAGGVMCGLG